MKAIIITLSFIFCAHLLWAQPVEFIGEGKIEFEKTINTHVLIRKEVSRKDQLIVIKEELERYKKEMPQFKVLQSILSFSNDKTSFLPLPEERTDVLSPHAAIAQPNVIYTDLELRKSVTQKNVLGDRFLIRDSLRKIDWKITKETREICGYVCRRANAIIMDSIYVVAFYTDQILAPGGPESFTGLPGMILGVVLPHDNITWYAKKITSQPVSSKEMLPPDKGREIPPQELRKIILSDGANKQKEQSAAKYMLL